MPGNTNNANLLDGVNQLILALNELTAATGNQVLNPTVNVAAPDVTVNNDVPVPSVTVEASPIPPAPNVNFDTQSIATAIDNQSNRIAPDGETLAGKLDTANTHFGNLVTGLGTANQHFSNIADRLAPDGESIQPTLLLLVDAMEAQLIDRAVVSELPTTITTYAADPKKCEYARRATGYAVKQIYYWKKNWGPAKILALTEISLAALLSGAVFAGATAVSLQAASDLIFHWGQSDIDNFYSEYTAVGDDLICAIYSAANASDAITAYTAVLDSVTWSGGQTSKDLIDLLFVPIAPINYVFSNPTYLLPKAQAGLELDDWSTFDCSTCTPPQAGNFDCMPRAGGWAYGTPTVITGGAWNIGTYPIGTWVTVTSQWNGDAGSSNHQRIGVITFDDDYTIELEILSIPVGKALYVRVNDCLEVSIVENTYNQVGAVYTGKMASLYVRNDPTEVSDPGTFQIRMRRLD